MEILDSPKSILEYFQRFWTKSRKTPYRIKVLDQEDYKVFLMIWPPGSATPLHDHDGVSVTIRVLQGALLREIDYTKIKSPYVHFTHPTRIAPYTIGMVIEEYDGTIPHRICNYSADEWAVSQHEFKLVDPGKYKMNVYEGEGGLVDGDDDIILPKFKIPLPKKRRK